MNIIKVFILFHILLIAQISIAKDQANWAHDTSDIAPDPAVRFGVLENGLRYAVMPHSEPPERISMRLYVDAGSLMETEEQQGLAHFIEHMAFNGTKNLPAGEMVEYFQRLGMSFGGDTNAHTSFKETVYKLELPKPEENLIKRAMLLFRDYADGMLMSGKEIEKERGVILSELITRDSAEWRTQKEAYKFALPDSLISKRFPIGTKKVIKGAGRKTFMDFYKTWYTPDRMSIVVVGAVKTDGIIAMIKKNFSSMPSQKSTLSDPDLGKITVGRGVITKTHYEKEATETNVSIEVVKPYSWEPDDTKKNVRNLKLFIANHIIDNRISELAKKKKAVITGGGSYAQDFLDFAQFASVYVTTEPDNWKGALHVAEQEIRRALTYGFNQNEFEEVSATLRNAYEQALRSSVSRKSRSLADALTRSISGQKVFTSPKQDIDWLNKNLALITADACHGELKKAWESSDRQIFIGGNIELNKADSQIQKAYLSSKLKEVNPPKKEDKAEFAYKNFGKPGQIVERKEDEVLGVVQLRFSNNVRLNLKKTDYEKDSISIGARIGSGMLSVPKDKPGLATVASAIFTAGGLKQHSTDELRRIFAGKTVSGSFAVDEDAFIYSGSTNRKDLVNALQLMTAYIVEPGYREEALRQFQNQLDPLYTQLAHTPMGVLQDRVDRFLKSDDFRAGFPSRTEITKRTIGEVKDWLSDTLESAYMEIGIVGDFEEQVVIDAVSKTLGALPTRRVKKMEFTGERRIDFPTKGQSKAFVFESEIPKGIVGVYWPTQDIWDISRTRRLSVLGAVFADRLRSKVREELGEAYSPYARHIPSDTYKGYGFLMSVITVDPPQAEKIVNVVEGIGTALASKGITEDELERAIKPLLNSIEQQLRQNAYWLRTVSLSSQEFPQKLNWAKTMLKDYQSIKVSDINSLAKKYLSEGSSVSVKIVPKESPLDKAP
ncbi:MAG: insulinase family protein [Verrucomicrobiales bacterium]|nr:insulinase family protein [Verrucomicrobiales bacterium]